MMSIHLGNRGSEDDNFVQFSNSLHELIHAGSLDHVYIMELPFYFNGNSEVGLVEYLLDVRLHMLTG